MEIAANTVVTLRYRIDDAQGENLDPGADALVYLHGGYGDFFEKIEDKLAGQEEGFESEFHLEPEDAFGDYDAELLRVVPRAELPEPVETGMQFEGVPDDAEDGETDGRVWRVTDLTEDVAVLDGNHPLAGLALRVWVQVTEVRPATDAEIEAGSAGSDPLFSVMPGELPGADDDDDEDLDAVLDGRGTLH
ncbi:FKBP-type peptidyl-prolyl cis-trans isomerase [Derxia lacustris]|uniref:FKBP-type peptidyl-prolyl cis-trans isomerase n=1 Tax=Derxia lacustris TaxID=764842 RepID=UPI000A17866B|nr:hypothetical protein [Derxia lacustris]